MKRMHSKTEIDEMIQSTHTTSKDYRHSINFNTATFAVTFSITLGRAAKFDSYYDFSNEFYRVNFNCVGLDGDTMTYDVFAFKTISYSKALIYKCDGSTIEEDVKGWTDTVFEID